MISMPSQVFILWGIGFLVVGALALIIWAYFHEESDDLDDQRHKKVVKDIEEELDRLKKL